MLQDHATTPMRTLFAPADCATSMHERCTAEPQVGDGSCAGCRLAVACMHLNLEPHMGHGITMQTPCKHAMMVSYPTWPFSLCALASALHRWAFYIGPLALLP